MPDIQIEFVLLEIRFYSCSLHTRLPVIRAASKIRQLRHVGIHVGDQGDQVAVVFTVYY